MARPLSAASLRRQAIDNLKRAIQLAFEKGDYAAAGAYAIRLEQMASRLAKGEHAKRTNGMNGRQNAMAPPGIRSSQPAAQGLKVGSSPY